MKVVRWGILGTGKIANRFAQAVKNAEGASLVAVASRSAATADAFAEKYQIAHRFSSYEAMAAFDGVDAVYIGLPHIYHPVYAKAMMEAGKHVLSEKPICVNAKQLEELRAVQARKQVFLMEALWTRFLPAIQQVKQMVDTGVIGTVLEVRADFCYNLEDRTHNVYNCKQAGGSLLDVGIYGLNFASMILGDAVAKLQTAVYQNNGVDERTHMLLTYENGAIANLTSALSLFKPEDGYIFGSAGYIRVPRFYGASEFEVITDAGTKTYHFPCKGNGFEEEIEECCRCILAGKTQSSIMPLEQSAVILRLMDQVRKQAGIVYDMD